MHRGYIKDYRKITEWEWYKDINVCHLFRHCLYKANIEDKTWRGILIKKGSFITSLENLAFESGLTKMQVRTALNKLKITHEITLETTRQYTIITVNNWELYQDNNTQNNTQPNTKITLTKEYKRNKEINIHIQNQFSEFYDLYPVKKERQKAQTAYLKAIKKASHEEIMQGLNNFITEIDIKKKKGETLFIKYPATWLNAGCWEDEYENETNKQKEFDYDTMPYNPYR